MFSGFNALLRDLQKLWATQRAGQLAPAVAPAETGYARLLTKAIDSRIDEKITIRQLAAFRIKLDRALLAEKRRAAPKPMIKALPRRVLLPKAKPKPIALISERDLQLVKLMAAHQAAR